MGMPGEILGLEVVSGPKMGTEGANYETAIGTTRTGTDRTAADRVTNAVVVRTMAAPMMTTIMSAVMGDVGARVAKLVEEATV